MIAFISIITLGGLLTAPSQTSLIKPATPISSITIVGDQKSCCAQDPNTAAASDARPFWSNIFDTTDFPPRWQCGTWSSAHGWLHIISDLLVWFAYLAIPCALVYFMRRRRDLPYRWLFGLFSLFIVACGTTHLLEAAVFWWPAYRFLGLVKAFTALVSLGTVVALLPVIPKALTLRSARELIQETADRVRAEEALAAAEAATRAKSDFLANMSHEIRTPMTAILGFSETLLESNSTQAEREAAVRTIQRNGNYLLTILNDILDLSKIEAGKIVVERIDCCLTEVVDEVITLLSPRAKAKGLQLAAEYYGPVPSKIQSDPVRIRQILINLVGNAIKFTDSGGVRLIVRMHENQSGKATIQFDVLDTGIGVPPERINHLFRPFTQADSSHTRRFGGCGLGLTISKRLSQILGGDLSLPHTTPEVGSCFRATLAAGQVDQQFMHKDRINFVRRQEVKSGHINSTSKKKSCRILLAEDGVDNQRLVKHILQRAGATVSLVENGRAAVNEALNAESRGQPFDVILMDMQMPIMDGYEATRELRRMQYSRPIVALTAHAMAGDREKCIAAGCTEYATKPIDQERLVALIQRLVAPSEQGVDLTLVN